MLKRWGVGFRGIVSSPRCGSQSKQPHKVKKDFWGSSFTSFLTLDDLGMMYIPASPELKALGVDEGVLHIEIAMEAPEGTHTHMDCFLLFAVFLVVAFL